MSKRGGAREAADNNIWRMPFVCWVSKATRTYMPTRPQTHTRKHLLLFHGNNNFRNAPQCYDIRTLPVFLPFLNTCRDLNNMEDLRFSQRCCRNFNFFWHVKLWVNTRWFKYDRDYLCVNKSQFVPVIFDPPCTNSQGIACHNQAAVLIP
jgi:hypothetical protein